MFEVEISIKGAQKIWTRGKFFGKELESVVDKVWNEE